MEIRRECIRKDVYKRQAKYTHEPYVGLSGPAVEQKLVGIDASEADRYYEICMQSSDEIMKSGLYGLYGAEPQSRDEAIVNYKKLFEDPSSVLNGTKEPIFIKGYTLSLIHIFHYSPSLDSA